MLLTMNFNFKHSVKMYGNGENTVFINFFKKRLGFLFNLLKLRMDKVYYLLRSPLSRR